MTGMGTAAAVLLAVVFVASGLAKLRRPRVTHASFAALGVPAPRALAVAIPAWELVLASLLVLRPAVGGAAALGTLAAFTGLLALRLAQRAQVVCGCFGRPGERLSAVALVRNALLAAGGLTALAAPRPAMPDVAALVAIGAAACTGALVLALARLRADLGRLWDNTLEAP